MSRSANDVAMEDQELPWAAGDPGPTVAAVLAGPAGRALRTVLPEGGGALPVLGVRSAGSAGPDEVGILDGAPDSADDVERLLARVVADRLALLVVCVPADQAARWTASARRLGAPLALAADEADVDRLRTAALELLVAHQQLLLQREDEIHQLLQRIVLAGGSLDELCHALAEVFGGSALVTSTDGRVLANAGTDGDLERVLALDCFDRSGRLLVEDEPLGQRAHGDARDHRSLVKIVAGGSELGLLAAFTRDRPFSGTDVHLLGRAATVAALAVTKEQAVSAVEGKYRAEFLRDALAGRSGSPTETIAHAAALGWDVDRRLVVVVAETDENDAETTRSAPEVRALQERFARAWTWAVRTKDASVPVAGFSQEVVVLLAVPDEADTQTIMKTVADYVRTVRGDGGGGRRSFSTGVSRPITSLAALPGAYEEALKAVSVGRQMHGDSALTHFDGLGIYRLLALVPDTADLRRFVVESLGELATDDTPENADLRHTLAVLLDTNLNVAETSRQLFFHYNTLRYRIIKLEKMLGPFTTDPQLRLTLALALRVHDMHGI